MAAGPLAVELLAPVVVVLAVEVAVGVAPLMTMARDSQASARPSGRRCSTDTYKTQKRERWQSEYHARGKKGKGEEWGAVRTLLLGEGGEGEASGQAGVVGQRVHRQGRHRSLRVCELCEGQDGAIG